jgi:hypothetical protein
MNVTVTVTDCVDSMEKRFIPYWVVRAAAASRLNEPSPPHHFEMTDDATMLFLRFRQHHWRMLCKESSYLTARKLITAVALTIIAQAKIYQTGAHYPARQAREYYSDEASRF